MVYIPSPLVSSTTGKKKIILYDDINLESTVAKEKELVGIKSEKDEIEIALLSNCKKISGKRLQFTKAFMVT